MVFHARKHSKQKRTATFYKQYCIPIPSEVLRKTNLNCFISVATKTAAGEQKFGWQFKFTTPCEVFSPKNSQQIYDTLSEGYIGYKVMFVKTENTRLITEGCKVKFTGSDMEFRVRNTDKISHPKKIIITIEEMENDGFP